MDVRVESNELCKNLQEYSEMMRGDNPSSGMQHRLLLQSYMLGAGVPKSYAQVEVDTESINAWKWQHNLPKDLGYQHDSNCDSVERKKVDNKASCGTDTHSFPMLNYSINAPVCIFKQRGCDREKELNAFLPSFQCHNFYGHFTILLSIHNKNKFSYIKEKE